MLVLVTAFVSLAIAPLVAAFVAKHLLGAKSKIFRDIQEQSVEKRFQQQTAIRQLASIFVALSAFGCGRHDSCCAACVFSFAPSLQRAT